MHIASMTGFARTEGEVDDISWVWEIKSVNGKGLDARCKLPYGYDRFEQPVRDKAQKAIRRGNMAINLSISTTSQTKSNIQINWAVLDEVIAAIPTISEKCPTATPPSIDGLLSLRGVMDSVDDLTEDQDQTAIDAALMLGFDEALEGLKQARKDEGGRVGAMLVNHVQRIEELQAMAVDSCVGLSKLLRERIKVGVATLLEEAPALPEERLAQEAALLITKSDVREEVDRLQAHCEAARDLLSSNEAIGRKFDFLCQEFNREANTLCSKASTPELSKIGLEMKVVIDQLREQIQNVE